MVIDHAFRFAASQLDPDAYARMIRRLGRAGFLSYSSRSMRRSSSLLARRFTASSLICRGNCTTFTLSLQAVVPGWAPSVDDQESQFTEQDNQHSTTDYAPSR
jgi:hypothetical protein